MYRTIIVEDIPTTRLDRYLKRTFDTLKQAQLEKWLRSKDIIVNGEKADAALRVKRGDKVQIKTVVSQILERQKDSPVDIYAAVALNREDADMFADLILYDDEEIIIVNKPSGLATQGGTNTTRHVDMLLKTYSHFFLKGQQLRLVHRLDRDTSGVLVIAKSLKAANHLADQFKMNTMEKVYWAVGHGKPSPLHGLIDVPLLKKSRPTGAGDIVVIDHKEGKKAQTTFRVLKSFGRYSWTELRPHTGRTHQLRVHMTYMGTPILGDTKYGEKEMFQALKLHPIKLHLHARSLKLRTLNGDVMTFTAAPPEHMVDTLHYNGIDWEQYS